MSQGKISGLFFFIHWQLLPVLIRKSQWQVISAFILHLMSCAFSLANISSPLLFSVLFYSCITASFCHRTWSADRVVFRLKVKLTTLRRHCTQVIQSNIWFHLIIWTLHHREAKNKGNFNQGGLCNRRKGAHQERRRNVGEMNVSNSDVSILRMLQHWKQPVISPGDEFRVHRRQLIKWVFKTECWLSCSAREGEGNYTESNLHVCCNRRNWVSECLLNSSTFCHSTTINLKVFCWDFIGQANTKQCIIKKQRRTRFSRHFITKNL